jgi:hypothetical protein
MAGDKNYFSHDLNARNDRKIGALVKDFKSSGLGIYWATCEMMHEEGGSLELDEITFAAIAKDVNESSSYIKKVLDCCVNNYKLFLIMDNILKSNRVTRNLAKRNDISDKRRNAAFAKHLQTNAEQADANAMQNGAKKERNKQRKKEESAVGFSEDGKEAIFKNGQKQPLTKDQQQLFQEGGYQPHFVKRNQE